MADLIKLVHVLGAAALFGAGGTMAFFMVMAHRSRDPKLIAHVSASLVVADLLVNLPVIVLQPATGLLLIYKNGWQISEGWIVVAAGLFAIGGLVWVPVAFSQKRMRTLAQEAVAQKSQLSLAYFRLYNLWFMLGIALFAITMVIFWLMVTKPQIPFY